MEDKVGSIALEETSTSWRDSSVTDRCGCTTMELAFFLTTLCWPLLSPLSEVRFETSFGKKRKIKEDDIRLATEFLFRNDDVVKARSTGLQRAKQNSLK
jgi:hypothetical protein